MQKPPHSKSLRQGCYSVHYDGDRWDAQRNRVRYTYPNNRPFNESNMTEPQNFPFNNFDEIKSGGYEANRAIDKQRVRSPQDKSVTWDSMVVQENASRSRQPSKESVQLGGWDPGASNQSWTASNEEAKPKRSMSRDGSVKFARATSTFESIKSEAMHLWETGVDLEFQQEEDDTKNKKKSLWLSATEFENAKSEDGGWSVQSNTFNFTAEKPDVPSNPPREPHERSFAEVANTHSGWSPTMNSGSSSGWSPVEETKHVQSMPTTPTQPMPYPPSCWPFVPNGQAIPKNTLSAKQHSPALPHRAPKMYMPLPIAGPRYTIPPGGPTSPIPMSPRLLSGSQENEIYSFLYCVSQNFSNISTFHERLDSILRQSIRLTHRTLGMFIRALTHVMVLERNEATKHSTRDGARLFTAEMLRYHFAIIIQAISGYLNTNVVTPLEFLPVLDLFALITQIYPELAFSLPIALAQECFERIKPTFQPDQIHQVYQHFKDIGRFVPPDTLLWPKNDGSQAVDLYAMTEDETDWSPGTEQQLASTIAPESNVMPLPDAAGLLEEACQADGSVASQHHPLARNHLMDITRHTHQDIYSYLTMHYNLLREQIRGPAVCALKNHAVNGPSTVEKIEDGWSTYSRLQPLFTTLAPTFSKPAIVLEAQLQDVTSDLPTECSWGILIPETMAGQPLQPYEEKATLLAKKNSVVSGIVAYAGVHLFNRRALSSNRVLFVFIPDESKERRFDWHKTYTMHTVYKNAAATFPTLNWLYERLSKHEAQDCSPGLAPFLIAPNDNARTEMTKGDNTIDNVPTYLQGIELDISSILVSGVRKTTARLGQTQEDCIWPQHISQQLSLPPSQRPRLYTLSPSQTKAVQHAISKPVTFISGKEGTGKTYIAGKLVKLLHRALITTQCYHPVLVITKRESTLDHILGSVIKDIPDVARLGANAESGVLRERDLCRLALPTSSDPNRRQWHLLEKQHATLQTRLIALWNYRWKVLAGDPAIMASTIPPTYEDVFRFGSPHASEKSGNNIPLQKLWMDWIEPVTAENGAAMFNSTTLPEHVGTIQRALSNSLRKKTGKAILPINTHQFYEDRQQWIERHLPNIPPIFSVDKWPFPTSKDAYKLQSALRSAWFEFTSDVIWTLPNHSRLRLQQRLKGYLLKRIEHEIDTLISEQTKIAESLDEMRRQKWTSVSRYNRVIGVTAHFAAANQELLNALGPRVILVEEAEDISESMIVPLLLQSRAEQLIVLGKSYSTGRPQFRNPEVDSNQGGLDISLFERWRLAGGEVLHLDEQWRLCSDISGIHDSVAGSAADQRLLITSPMANENYANQSAPTLLGLDHRAFFVDIQSTTDEGIVDTQLSSLIKSEVKLADADEARMVCHLALYLCQQGYKGNRITILAIDPLQKSILQAITKAHISKYSYFTGGIDTVKIDLVENYHGKENSIVLLWLGSPSAALMSDASISLAVSRGRFGLYMVGASSTLRHTRWYNVLQHMKNRGLLAHQISLKCQKHKEETTLVGKWVDFDNVKNGGCLAKCNTLLDCGHVCEETCHHLKHAFLKCEKSCDRQRPPPCAHSCPNKCFECKNGECPPCYKESSIKRPCGHVLTGTCNEIINKQKQGCSEIVDYTLPCGHTQSIECSKASESTPLTCTQIVEVKLDCGHTVKTPCGYKPICTATCDKPLECGHPCPEPCGTDHALHSRRLCTASCPKQLICGHYCAKGCANPDKHTERCLEPCGHVCLHGYRCGRECYRVCNRCNSPCPYACAHAKCTKRCFEKCDRPPCNRSCGKKLACSHPCIGLCGEPCPPCKICNPNTECKITLRTLSEFDKDEKAYMLPECGCVFSVESLDLFFRNQAKSGEHTAVKLWQCPSCRKPIYTALRYNMYIKTEIALVNQIKGQQELARQRLSQEEKSDIINAMNEEAKLGVHNIVGGRWFVCENGHPYYIGECGGATEISKCPQCGVIIGGLQHKVVESNRFYGEFDGSFEPAWPGQPGQPSTQK